MEEQICHRTTIEEFVKNIIKNGTMKDQTDFHNISPVFKLGRLIISIWIELYSSIDSGPIKPRGSVVGITKNNIMRFLEIGLTGYLCINTSDKLKLVKKLSKHKIENRKYIDLINVGLTKSKSLDTSSLESLRFIKRRSMLKDHFSQKYTSVDFMEIPSLSLKKSPKKSICDLKVSAFVNTINNYYIDILKHLRYIEFVNYLVNHKTSNHLGELIELSNKLYNLVPVDILMKNNTKKKQIKTIKKILKIAELFLKTNNFDAVFAIISGLNDGTIQRIKYLWEDGEKHTIKFHQLEKIISYFHGFSYYRNIIKDKKEYIPYTGLVLSDLDKMLQPELINPTDRFIDITIYKMLVGAANLFESVIPRNSRKTNKDILKMIKEWTIIDESDLYKISYELQIQGSTSRQIELQERIESVESIQTFYVNESTDSTTSYGSNNVWSELDSPRIIFQDSDILREQEPPDLEPANLEYYKRKSVGPAFIFSEKGKTDDISDKTEQNLFLNKFNENKFIQDDKRNKKQHRNKFFTVSASGTKDIPPCDNARLTKSNSNFGSQIRLEQMNQMLKEKKNAMKKSQKKTSKKTKEKLPPYEITTTTPSNNFQLFEMNSNISEFPNQKQINEFSYLWDIQPKYWTNRDVIKWLKFIEMNEYEQMFLYHGITGFSLIKLTTSDLDYLQIIKLGHRIRIIEFIDALNISYNV